MRFYSYLLALLACVAMGYPAQADSLSVGFTNGVANSTDTIVNFKTTGMDMTGMAVTFTFTDGSSATSFWSGGSNSLGTNNGVTLSLTGDTYFSQWHLRNLNKDGLGVTQMVVDAGLGNTVFDQTFGNSQGTPLSSSGRTFNPTAGFKGLDITATYSDIVSVNPNAALGDLYRTLTVDFTNQGGLFNGRRLTFWSDTDTVEGLGDPQSIRTPAPPALLLALLGVPLLFRRRKAD